MVPLDNKYTRICGFPMRQNSFNCLSHQESSFLFCIFIMSGYHLSWNKKWFEARTLTVYVIFTSKVKCHYSRHVLVQSKLLAYRNVAFRFQFCEIKLIVNQNSVFASMLWLIFSEWRLSLRDPQLCHPEKGGDGSFIHTASGMFHQSGSYVFWEVLPGNCWWKRVKAQVQGDLRVHGYCTQVCCMWEG